MYANIIYADKICKKKITEIKNVLIFLWKIYRWAKMQSNQWIVCGVYAYIIVSESQQGKMLNPLGTSIHYLFFIHDIKKTPRYFYRGIQYKF